MGAQDAAAAAADGPTVFIERVRALASPSQTPAANRSSWLDALGADPARTNPTAPLARSEVQPTSGSAPRLWLDPATAAAAADAGAGLRCHRVELCGSGQSDPKDQ